MIRLQFKTTDIVLAASLRINNFTLKAIDISGSRGTFVFEDVDDEFLTQYDLSLCRVEPIAFNNAIKTLTTSVRRMTGVR